MEAIELQGSSASASGTTLEKPSVFGLVEDLLKEPLRVDRVLIDGRVSYELVTRLLAIALGGFTVFGIVLATIFDLAGSALPWLPAVRWSDGSALSLLLAYDFGMIAACGICLPSFYFYNQLGGVRMSMVETVAHAIKCLGVNAIVLVGVLPLYVALALGVVVFGATAEVQWQVLGFGLALPFVTGLWGVRSLYRGFLAVAQRQNEQEDAAIVRTQFTGRLLLAWAAVYTAVTPVMIYTVWTALTAGGR